MRNITGVIFPPKKATGYMQKTKQTIQQTI